MTAERVYISTTIPYVNARPHLGFALELVQADVLARHRRQVGDLVRFQTGTDDNSLKNVLAAEAEGISTDALVERNASAFAELRDPLALSFDDFIRTSSDPRHLAGVERLWRACAASGDLYHKHYAGQYCVGCEQFYKPAELRDGRCPEHGTPPQRIAEENWFFRLSRYAGQLHELIDSGRLRIEPAGRRNEVLGFIEGGLEDFSASRSTARARGWGIGVPGDPSQVIYVWWDALGNYITALGYGAGADDYQRWWGAADRRIHLAGKGVLRFHAVYWPAILLSAGEPLPTDILVHDYLTIDGRKISKSPSGQPGAAAAAAAVAGELGVAGGPDDAVDPAALAGRFGTDAVRWWLLREVPRVGDADFTVARLVARANDDLANDLGNLVSRVVSLVHRYRDGRVPRSAEPPAGERPEARPLTEERLAGQRSAGQQRAGELPAGELLAPEPLAGELLARERSAALPGGDSCDPGALLAACRQAPQRVSAALEAFDFRRATAAVWEIVEEANRYIERTAPWHLAGAERAGDVSAGYRLDAVLEVLVAACRELARQLAPFVPGLAAGIAAACDYSAGRLAAPRQLFPRLS
jgi:methionyl-tRNA synthetase